jgi:hypothetical protein
MRRRAVAGPVLAAAVGLAILTGGCGTSAHHASSGSTTTSTTATIITTTTTTPASAPPPARGGRLTVTPAEGHPTSTVRFTLVALTASGRHGQSQLSYALSITGGQGSGCVAQHGGPIAVRRPGQPVTVAVGPAQLGGSWCPGSYVARVDELARPVCGPAQVCPQFIRVVAAIGPVRFRITR